MAPEVLDRDYTQKADMWSIGVMLYVLLCGYLPFQGKEASTVFARIRTADFHFKHKEFEEVSEECKDLIRKLFVIDPAKRLTAEQAFQHPWFKKVLEEIPSPERPSEVVERLRAFRGVSSFKRAVMNALVKSINSEEVAKLTTVFEKIDTSGDGMISAKELSEYLKQKHLKLSDSEI